MTEMVVIADKLPSLGLEGMSQRVRELQNYLANLADEWRGQ